jgi:hypothetical protein
MADCWSSKEVLVAEPWLDLQFFENLLCFCRKSGDAPVGSVGSFGKTSKILDK